MTFRTPETIGRACLADPIRGPLDARCCSSVVERTLGKGEVGSSILPSSTILFSIGGVFGACGVAPWRLRSRLRRSVLLRPGTTGALTQPAVSHLSPMAPLRYLGRGIEWRTGDAFL
ncbi:hypothetical protein NOVOSPHI9U_50439 [Novosphingobium sp. 9U]|nr:hypothetical protein NOVOSPHI9U_50439 [Novosphingobium sp. 9U]